MKLIEVKNLYKVYGTGEKSFVALMDINLSINKGETVAIIGKSGAGKSTLMHILALLDKPSKGQVLFLGKECNELRQKEQNQLRNKTFGFVFQQFFMNGHHSVMDNVTLPLQIEGISKSQRNKRGIDVLERVGLKDKYKSKASDLSGGQKQRLCIARALINRPQIIFADEPTGNLDSTNGKIVADTLFEMNRKLGITLIIVTHDMELAKRCDRRIIIKDGMVIGGEEN